MNKIDQTLPTYKEWTSDMNLCDMIKFYYDVDIDNFTGDPWKILAEAVTNEHWLQEFHVRFAEYLREREYIS